MLAMVETIQHLCWYFETELDLTLQSRSVVDDQVARETSEVALGSSCFFVVCCHREEPSGVVRCKWRSTFAFGSPDLSDHGGDIQNTDVVTSKTDENRLPTEIETLYNSS